MPTPQPEPPASPTEIDPDLQAQAWALLPDLAKDLNNLRNSGQRLHSATTEEACKKPEEEASKQPAVKARNHQEGVELQSVLLQSRIPASQKGKAVQIEEGIHGGQPTGSYVQATSQVSASKIPSNGTNADSSTRLRNHQWESPFAEEGWELAKLHRRRKQDTMDKVIHISHRPGSAFFKSKMGGRCYNCFSPNHLARSCHRLPRCWKCYRSGHRAIDCYPNSQPLMYKRGGHQGHRHQRRTPEHQSPSINLSASRTDHRSFAEVVKGKEDMAAARYPGDPRARPARGYCTVSATGDIRRRRDELIGRAAVCWLNGNSHDTAPHHLSDALRNQLDIHHDDVQVLKHFPEQFLVIFNNPRDRQRVVEVGVLPDNGRRFQFDAWSERRYANNIKWEFRVKVRIEGIPVHCWAEEVAAMALGKSCVVHYLEETTRRRQRTRSFDLWAWCFDPCDIPTEVLLTVTEPDRGHPHQDEPLDLKRGQVYVLRNHLEVVEDLTFLQEPGRLGGPLNRKARRVFDWDYGMPDTKGERLHGRRGQDRGRDIRPRRDDDDYDDRRARGNRRHRSISVWARNSRCRGGAEDCISSNRWRGRGESPPHRSRPAGAPTQVWVAKEQKQEKMVKEQEKLVKEQKLEKKIKKVSFADPIATELRAPKVTIPDDSIMFIKDTALKQLEQHIVPGGVCPVDNTPTAEPGKAMEEPRGEQLGASKEKRLEQLLDHLNEFLHFARPMEKNTIEAIQGLIEHANGCQKTGLNLTGATGAPMLLA